ncbi:hypothetical protein HA466_0224730 [Hirschfeldia incana]|nr:hypothetical protein HA466_0224730 [Hirschfeldia incana]
MKCADSFLTMRGMLLLGCLKICRSLFPSDFIPTRSFVSNIIEEYSTNHILYIPGGPKIVYQHHRKTPVHHRQRRIHKMSEFHVQVNLIL